MINKCTVCKRVKGKRRCLKSGQMICSKCCGEIRSWVYCNTECEYFPYEVLNYTPYNSQKAELITVSNGMTTKFEVPLFLPNLFDVITCTVKELRIDLLDFNKAIVSISFKLDSNREVGNEIYLKDNWKIQTSNVQFRNDTILAPLVIMSTSQSSNCNYVQAKCKYGESSLSLIKTSYSLNVWLPHARSSSKNIDVKDMPEFESDYVSAVVHQGRLASKKNDVFWAEFNTKFEYKVSFQIENADVHIKQKQLSLLYLGIFLPYKKVIIEKYTVNKPNSFSINEESFLALQTFGDYEDKRLWEIPLELNFGNNYHGGFVKKLISELPSIYHFDEYLYKDYFFFLNHDDEISANLLFNTENIVSAYFNVLKEVYDGKYSPIILVISNMSEQIRKIKVVYEIKGLSDRCIETVYLEPLNTSSIPLFPILNDIYLSKLNEHSSVQFFVEVYYKDTLIYEDSKRLNLLPKETFVYDSEDLGKSNKYYFYSFLSRWVTPNSVSVERIINEAAQSISGFEGMSEDLGTVTKEIGALYRQISLKMKYVSKTFSLYKGTTSLHQKVHLPDNTFSNSGGNCIDLVIFMASCLEKLGYYPLIIIVPEHSYLGIKFDKFTIFLEMTQIGEISFDEAIIEGNKVHDQYFNINNNPREENCVIIDVKESRKAQIFPMN